MIHLSRVLTLAIVFTGTASSVALGEDGSWGNLSGRFIYDGKPPKAKTFEVTKDVKAIGKTVPDESLVVNPKNRGIANVVVYLRTKKDAKLRVHPSYAATAKDKVTMSMRKGRFVPHVLLIRTSQLLVQRSRDDVPYSPSIQCLNNDPG